MDSDYDRDPEGNSIDTQRQVTAAKEAAMGSVNVGEYVEPGYSGQAINKRPFFQQLLQRIIERRDVDYVVIYMRSRVFRNYIEACAIKAMLADLGVKVISAKEDFGDGFMGEAMEAITDVFNWLQVKMSGQDIKTKMGNKARNGGTIGRAKIGYLNQRVTIDGHKVNIIAIDPERSHYIPMAFELFATGLETIASLQAKLTTAGLRMPPTKTSQHSPISHERLRLMLRDHYYVGYVTYEGIEHPGRHPPLITEELYARVQTVLGSHTGSGTRHRTHHHYLKGLLWCARSRHRMIFQRAQGRNGGEYFYYFCAARQKGQCDLPYLPITILEQAVTYHYQQIPRLTASDLSQLRTAMHDALTLDHSATVNLRAQYTKRITGLRQKEKYLLNRAAEGNWPRTTLQTCIDELHTERTDLATSITRLDQQRDRNRHAFDTALAMLENPATAYHHGNDRVRAIMNQALLGRLYIDADKAVARSHNLLAATHHQAAFETYTVHTS